MYYVLPFPGVLAGAWWAKMDESDTTRRVRTPTWQFECNLLVVNLPWTVWSSTVYGGAHVLGSPGLQGLGAEGCAASA